MYDALVLAGGDARRMGGADKPSLLVGGTSLLDRVLTAVDSAARTVVVGPGRAVARPVLWAREEPPGGEPVAALAAGLSLVTADVVVLLAADLPFLDAATVGALLAVPGSLLVDETGRDQLLCSCWPTAALREALEGVEVEGGRLAPVLLPLVRRRVRLEPPQGRPPPWSDCDTEDDLRRARDSA